MSNITVQTNGCAQRVTMNTSEHALSATSVDR